VPVQELLLARLPVSVEPALWAGIPMIIVGVWLGVIAATHHSKPIDQGARVFSIHGFSPVRLETCREVSASEPNTTF
jgi:ABC-type dipeptide/oligopeptide/nickel transport system permease component